uniref:Uncharacterized protein n=1 Tax=Chlamydomonas leiostraca TaxID=1034604 RepID=A0A7S0RTN6_9CHLO
MGPRHWVTHAAALMAAEVAVASLREQVLGNERAGRTVPEVVASVELWVGGVGQWLGSLPPFPDTRHTDVLPGYASVAAGGAAGGRKGAPQPERMRSPTSADAGGGGAEGQEGERADAVSGLLLSLAEPLAAVVDLARTPGSQLGRYGGAGVRREVVGSARLIKLVGWLAGNAGLTWEHTRSWPNPAQQLKTVDKLQHWLTAQHEK